MVASFRPLAEIGCMLGRSWMWPVPASPIFSWNSPTWGVWKLDDRQCKLHFKTHLPYNRLVFDLFFIKFVWVCSQFYLFHFVHFSKHFFILLTFVSFLSIFYIFNHYVLLGIFLL